MLDLAGKSSNNEYLSNPGTSMVILAHSVQNACIMRMMLIAISQKEDRTLVCSPVIEVNAINDRPMASTGTPYCAL